MEFDDTELSDESLKIVANLRIALIELASTLSKLDKSIKMLESAWIKEQREGKSQIHEYATRSKAKG